MQFKSHYQITPSSEAARIASIILFKIYYARSPECAAAKESSGVIILWLHTSAIGFIQFGLFYK